MTVRSGRPDLASYVKIVMLDEIVNPMLNGPDIATCEFTI